MNNSNSFDYTIIGAGASGLLLADAIGRDPFFGAKSILLIEKEAKKANDRSWCFWEQGEGQFDSIVHKSWDRIYFGGKKFSGNLEIAPYTYKMIRAIDFYEAFLGRIKTYPNVTFIQETVVGIAEQENNIRINTNNSIYYSSRVFNSSFNFKSVLEQHNYPVLQQHFIGWFIKTEKPVFDPKTACFMDFAIPQQGNTRFMYVLPFKEDEALVEYTLFSENLLKKQEYEAAIKSYIADKFENTNYQILDTEKGRIPMSCYNFESQNSERMIYIGTAGGWSKPSTGFTFMNSARNVSALTGHLKKNCPLHTFTTKSRFWYYDLLLLDILHRNNEKGQLIFESLFKNSEPQQILKFLEEKTSIPEDLKIIYACPKKEFIGAFLRRLLT